MIEQPALTPTERGRIIALDVLPAKEESFRADATRLTKRLPSGEIVRFLVDVDDLRLETAHRFVQPGKSRLIFARAFDGPVAHRRERRILDGARGPVRGLVQRRLQRADNQTADQTGIAKPYFCLCWMHIDVDKREIAIEEKGRHRVAVAREIIRIRSFEGTQQQPVPHGVSRGRDE